MADLLPLEYDMPSAARGVNGASANPYAGWRPEELRQAQRVIDANRARAAAAAAPAGGAAPSMPIGENAAPVATSAAESTPSFGSRVLNGMGRFGNGLRMVGRVAGPVGVGATALDLGYEGGKMLTPDNAAVGMADALGRVGEFFGIKNGYAGGADQYAAAAARGDMNPAAKPAPAAAGPAPNPAGDYNPNVYSPNATPPIFGSPEYTASRDAYFQNLFREGLDRKQVPGNVGVIRNDTTGGVSTVSAPVPRSVPVPQPRAAEAQPGAPVLGGNGPIFDNLNSYVNDFGQYAFSQAQQGRGLKYGAKAAELAVKREDIAANRLNQKEIADARMKQADAQVEHNRVLDEAGKRKVVMGVDGTPIVVDMRDPNNPKSTKVVPFEKPTWEKFRDEARKVNPDKAKVTDAHLRAYYNKQYGG